MKNLFKSVLLATTMLVSGALFSQNRPSQDKKQKNKVENVDENKSVSLESIILSHLDETHKKIDELETVANEVFAKLRQNENVNNIPVGQIQRVGAHVLVSENSDYSVNAFQEIKLSNNNKWSLTMPIGYSSLDGQTNGIAVPFLPFVTYENHKDFKISGGFHPVTNNVFTRAEYVTNLGDFLNQDITLVAEVGNSLRPENHETGQRKQKLPAALVGFRHNLPLIDKDGWNVNLNSGASIINSHNQVDAGTRFDVNAMFEVNKTFRSKGGTETTLQFVAGRTQRLEHGYRTQRYTGLGLTIR